MRRLVDGDRVGPGHVGPAASEHAQEALFQTRKNRLDAIGIQSEFVGNLRRRQWHPRARQLENAEVAHAVMVLRHEAKAFARVFRCATNRGAPDETGNGDHSPSDAETQRTTHTRIP